MSTSPDPAEDCLRAVGSKETALVVWTMTVVVALVMFAMLASHGSIGRIDDGPMVLFAGEILGDLLNATLVTIR